MEIDAVARRIIAPHWRLISFVLVYAVVVAAFLPRPDSTYTASARLVLDTRDPESRAESSAIADTAKAIATSPSLVADALDKAGVRGHDPIEVASKRVSVRALGTSGVLQLSVRDEDPRIAAAIANRLSAVVIESRLDVTRGEVDSFLNDLNDRIVDLSHKIAAADRRIDALNVQMVVAPTAAQQNRLRADRDERSRTRDFLAQQRSLVESERVALLSNDALRPRPSIISHAGPAEQADPSRRWADLLLGGLLGLFAGVGLAALIETFRPTLVGGDAIAQELGIPFVGTIPGGRRGEENLRVAARTATRVTLAAERAGVGKINLVGAGAAADPDCVAQQLKALPAEGLSSEEPMSGGIEGASAILSAPTIAVGLDGSSRNGGRPGVVVVAPRRLKRAELVETAQLLRVIAVPVLGLVTHGRMSSRRARAALPWRAASQVEGTSTSQQQLLRMYTGGES